jgi:glycosyltransferase involved in cell wall biosynthesis
MKICYLIGAFHPVVGGGETQARLLCSEFKKQGQDVFVLTRRTKSTFKVQEEVDGVTVYRLPPSGRRRINKYFMLVPAFFRLIKMRKDYDIIIVSGLRMLSVVAMLMARIYGKKCVLRGSSCGELSGAFIWDSPHLEKQQKPSPILKALVAVRNKLLLKADGFVGISEVIAEEYRQCGVSEKKIKMICNGTDMEKYRPLTGEERTQLRLNLGVPDKTVFAYSGKLNKGKGLEFLLELWSKLTEGRDDLHLLLVGAGLDGFLSCEDQLRDYVLKNNLSDTVTFTGYVNNVYEFLQCSDFFVLPSENEAASNSLIEALACGVPCFGSDVGGIPDSLKDGLNGRLLPVGSMDEWLKAIREALDNRARAKKWGEQGRDRVMKHNGIENVVKKYVEFLKKLETGN